jgi:hypothetical protein
MRLTRRALIAGAPVVLMAGTVRADEITSPVPGKRVAISGYDPVAYFTDNHPVQGVSKYWYEFDDTVYLFATAAHRAMFVSDPEHYAPQFRGFCTLSTSIGGHDEGLPDQWKVVDDKLYVFGKPTGMQDFEHFGPDAVITQARAQWTLMHKK